MPELEDEPIDPLITAIEERFGLEVAAARRMNGGDEAAVWRLRTDRGAFVAHANPPPLVSFCPSRTSLTWSRMRRAGRFGVNVLGREHQRFAMRATPAGADWYAGLGWELGGGGAPLLTDALATLECEIGAEHPAGDHWIVVGQVDALHTSPNKDPLLFFAGEFGALQQPK